MHLKQFGCDFWDEDEKFLTDRHFGVVSTIIWDCRGEKGALGRDQENVFVDTNVFPKEGGWAQPQRKRSHLNLIVIPPGGFPPEVSLLRSSRHAQLEKGPKVDPELTGGFMHPVWPGNTLGFTKMSIACCHLIVGKLKIWMGGWIN